MQVLVNSGFKYSLLFDYKLGVILLIIFCYVMGLLSFVVGRFLRELCLSCFRKGKFKNNCDEYFKSVLDAHGLSELEPFKSYIDRKESRGVWKLYIRLWAELRCTSGIESSMLLLRRYWVMTATYDGLTTSFLIWIVALGIVRFDYWWCIALVLGLFSVFSGREAYRYFHYQIEEVVATTAALRAKDY